MKALALVTHTADCEKTWRSFECLGHEVTVTQYDDRPHDRQDEFVTAAALLQPHVIIYIGAIEKYHGRPVLQPDVLRRLNDIAPTIHICGDASDRPWWEWLEVYERHQCFSAQVSIDGVMNAPIAEFKNGLVLLTPLDPQPFECQQVPWHHRTVAVGMSGGLGHGERAKLVAELTSSGHLTWNNAQHGGTYRDMAGFMCRSKIIINSPMNGTGDSDHVKGRVIEAGFAGACLFERAKSPTRRWFLRGVEYVEYHGVEDARKKIAWARDNEIEIMKIAHAFQRRVVNEHHPRVFWGKVLELAGVPC